MKSHLCLLCHRRKHHVCCHIRGYGLILHVHQQLLKASALAALAAWTHASKQYRHQLQWRVIAAWRHELQSSQQLQAAAQHMREDRRKRQIVHAWAQFMEQQVTQCGPAICSLLPGVARHVASLQKQKANLFRPSQLAAAAPSPVQHCCRLQSWRVDTAS